MNQPLVIFLFTYPVQTKDKNERGAVAEDPFTQNFPEGEKYLGFENVSNFVPQMINLAV